MIGYDCRVILQMHDQCVTLLKVKKTAILSDNILLNCIMLNYHIRKMLI